MKSKKIIIIGSGFGGLAAGCLLATHGHQVEIFEKREQAGGRAYSYSFNQFSFDGGPSVITAPDLLREIFSRAGKKQEAYFQLVPVNPFYRIFNSQGIFFDYSNEIGSMREQIQQLSPEDVKGFEKLMKALNLGSSINPDLLQKPQTHFFDLLKNAPALFRLENEPDLFEFVGQFIHDEFLKHALSFHPLLIGSNPFKTGASLLLNMKKELEHGVFYPVGGTKSIIHGLVKLFNELGGKLHLNQDVKQIVTQQGRAIGVRLKDNSVLQADVVISNADTAYTYQSLLEPSLRKKNTDRRFNKLEYSFSLFVIYFGTSRRYTDTNLAHHNILINVPYQKLVEDIFYRKILSTNAFLYLHMPTLTDSSIAPPGCESFYVMSPVPDLSAKLDWAQISRSYRDQILDYLEENYLPDLKANIIVEHHLTPLHFKQTLNSHLGAAYATQNISNQSNWFRPHIQSEDVNNLYFVGAGTQPGAGLPAVLYSALFVDRLINK